MNGERKQILILGNGYAGCTAALKLDKVNEIEVTLVGPRDFFYNKIAGLRASTAGGNW